MGSPAVAVTVFGRPTPDLAAVATRSFEEFVEPHWAAMAALARRMAGPAWEDVLQDALALAWRRRDSYDPSRGSPRVWLLTLVADQTGKVRRRALRRPESVVAEVPDSGAAGLDPSVRLDIERAVTALPRRQRLAVDLFYFLDLPVADVAAVMGCSEGTVKSTLSDARKRLRSELGDFDG